MSDYYGREMAKRGQLSLFDNPSTPTASASANVSHKTRREAHGRALSRGATQRDRVLNAIRIAGANGATRHELATELGLGINSITPRVCELMKQTPRVIYQQGTRDGSAVIFAKGFGECAR